MTCNAKCEHKKIKCHLEREPAYETVWSQKGNAVVGNNLAAYPSQAFGL